MDIIERLSLITHTTFINLTPDALSPTLDIQVDVSKVNVFFSDFLILSIIELLFGTQEMFNLYVEEGNKEEEEEKETEIEEFGAYQFDESPILEEPKEHKPVKYEIVDGKERAPPVDEDKVQKWLSQVNQRLS